MYTLYDLFILGKHYLSFFTQENDFNGIKIRNGWRFTTRTSGFAFDFNDNTFGIRIAVDFNDENIIVAELIKDKIAGNISTGKITLDKAKTIPVNEICKEAVSLWAPTVYKHNI